jgi:DNA-binding response OmpR family regulator
MRILVVEDEQVLREGLSDLLCGAGYEVAAACDGAEAVERGTDEHFDLVLLDLMLPKLNGIEVLTRLRRVRPGLPIIMLTARGDEDDKVAGLTCGADDYVTKPFSARELLARIAAVGRRMVGDNSGEDRIQCEENRFDLGRCQVEREGEVQSLTPREVGVIRWLYRHRDRAVSRGELLENVWGVKSDTRTRTVDMTVAKLRQKIEPDPSNPRIIVTVTGAGYGWGEAV